MLYYLLRRLVYMVIVLIAVSVVAFVVIQLPPGDWLSSYIIRLKQQSQHFQVSEAEIVTLRKQFGLDQPVFIQYFKWIWNIVRHGNFGRSFEWNMPVSDLIWDRIAMTTVIALFSMGFVYALAIPIGVYSATHQYSASDYFFTVVGYAGLATPNFMLALILMFIAFRYFGASVGGLFSPQYIEAPWSLGKILDMLSHLWVPVVVLGTSGTARIIRIMRGMLLDELKKQYVITARAKGVKEFTLLFKYPVRIAINPIVSVMGWELATIISGAAIVSMVLSLPSTGPLLIKSLLSQDMYLAGTFILLLCVLTVIGTFVSDILLALIDPRIRM